ncbi:MULTISPECIES: phosphoribosylformylglycinamidine cyclo-ligase [Euryhalocaulis]|uniref:phosphoribosylformylglycinamidine cyclo-ligase n=1 Tax=Euryhalocaulis TaxID=1712422 RepID=UPI00039CC457|nr:MULTISPECIES: phosphoribosylformylglycinamidine cyclo-ligase [Euryhalocaulis]MBA4800242.1 phosphoribosylformylglycinamidine cyclo-ligase [Euryhalocaulis sp.]
MAEDKKTPLTYKDSGVDIDAGDKLVDLIKPLAKATRRPGAEGDLGGFGGAFDLKAAGYQDPVLISGTDGVGTKLKVAIDSGRFDGLGADLVAMCVNDVLVQGAEPLFFLDYFATGELDPTHAAEVIAGIASGCRDAGCALIGGETAEMPGIYGKGEFDLAGFVVGAVERHAILPREKDMAAGDVLIGIASSGAHSNGYSLIRRVVEREGLAVSDPAPFTQGSTLGDALLAPTRIYVRSVLPLLKAGKVKGAAHITGGGLTENLPRMLPKSLNAEIDYDAWPRPALFSWLQEAGGIEEAEMRRTFNLGVGMVLCVAAEDADSTIQALEDADECVWKIGKLAAAK